MPGKSGTGLRYFAGVAAAAIFLGLGAAGPAHAQSFDFQSTIETGDHDGDICSKGPDTWKTTEIKNGKDCVLKLDYPVGLGSDGYMKFVRVVKRNASASDAMKCWGDAGRKGVGLYGLADKRNKISVKPQYTAIQPISTVVAIAKKCDGTLVIVDGGSHSERPFSYEELAIYPKAFDYSDLVSSTGHNPPHTPPVVIARTAARDGGYRDYALIGADGSAATILPNISDPDERIRINSNGIIFATMADPDTEATVTGIFDTHGTNIGIFPEIVTASSQAILGKPNPHPLAGYDHYLIPLNPYTGLPVDLPADIVGLDYADAKWIVVTRQGDELRYRISLEPVLETLAQYQSLTPYRDILPIGSDDESLSYGKAGISDEIRQDWHKPGPAWWWSGKALAVQLEDGKWAMFDDTLDGQPVEAATPQEAFAARYDAIYDQVMAYQNGKALDEQRAIDARRQRRANLVASFEQHLGHDPSEGGCAYPVYNDATMLGGEYLERYVETYGPCNLSDVDAVCRQDGPACSAARRVKSNWEAQMWKEDAERRALAESLNQSYQTNSDEVSVLVIEGGQMKQQVMSKEHYDKYYAPN
ncbi:MAG: hypothetical protein KDA43_10465 [Hyphomonas sp.]|nr:hypothetical protein [Hyphomonas sp.]